MDEFCELCEQKLNKGRIVWLELNLYTHTWHANEGEVPEDESQGWFPFGAACARKVLKV